MAVFVGRGHQEALSSRLRAVLRPRRRPSPRMNGDLFHFFVYAALRRLCLAAASLLSFAIDRTKKLIAIVVGRRESEISWNEVLLRLQARGLMHAPELAS